MKKLNKIALVSVSILLGGLVIIETGLQNKVEALAKKASIETVENMFTSPDINSDGQVDEVDFEILVTNWGIADATPEQGDLNGDTKIDALDLSYFNDYFSETPTPEPTLDSGSLVITPETGSATIGSPINVSLVMTGANVNVVTAKLNYDQTKLNCNSVDDAEFPVTLIATCENGKIEITKFTIPGEAPLSGSKVVASITFTAIEEGLAEVNIQDAQVVSKGKNILGAIVGGAYTITVPTTTDGRGSDDDSIIVVAPVVTTAVQSASTSTDNYSNLVADYNGVYNVASGDNTIASSSTNTDKKTEKEADKKDEKNENKAEDKPNKSNNGQKILAILALAAIAVAFIAAGRARAAKEAELAAAAATTEKTATKNKKATAKSKANTKKKK